MDGGFFSEVSPGFGSGRKVVCWLLSWLSLLLSLVEKCKEEDTVTIGAGDASCLIGLTIYAVSMRERTENLSIVISHHIVLPANLPTDHRRGRGYG